MLSEPEALRAELLKAVFISNADSRPIVTLEDDQRPRKSKSARLRFATKDVVEDSLQELCRS
jgi:hypothetical protein